MSKWMMALSPFPNMKLISPTRYELRMQNSFKAAEVELKCDQKLYTRKDGSEVKFSAVAALFRWHGINLSQISRPNPSVVKRFGGSLYYMGCGEGANGSVTCFANSSKVLDKTTQIFHGFEKLKQKGAYKHHYTNLEDQQWDEAEEKMKQVIDAYENID